MTTNILRNRYDKCLGLFHAQLLCFCILHVGWGSLVLKDESDTLETSGRTHQKMARRFSKVLDDSRRF
jgi:hypothetical protein